MEVTVKNEPREMSHARVAFLLDKIVLEHVLVLSDGERALVCEASRRLREVEDEVALADDAGDTDDVLRAIEHLRYPKKAKR